MPEQNTQTPEGHWVVSTSGDAEVEPASLAIPSADANNSALTPTARAIHAILNAGSAQSPTDVFVALSMLAIRPLPPTIVTHELEPKHQPRCCCFDQSHATPSWTTHSVCARCMLLYQLIKGCRSMQSAVAARVLVGTSILITNCVSETDKTESTSSLPVELIYLVIEHAVDDMRRKRDGSAVARLLHVSSWVRYKTVQNFEEVMIYEEAQRHSYEIYGSLGRLIVDRNIGIAVWQVMREYWRDVSIRRHSKEAEAKSESDDLVMTKTGTLFLEFTCHVSITTAVFDEYDIDHVNNDKQESLWRAIKVRGKHGGFIRVSDIRGKLLEIIRHKDLQPTPYLASPYYRAACLGKFDGTDAQVRFEVCLVFARHAIDTIGRDITSLSWNFTNNPCENHVY